MGISVQRRAETELSGRACQAEHLPAPVVSALHPAAL